MVKKLTHVNDNMTTEYGLMVLKFPIHPKLNKKIKKVVGASHLILTRQSLKVMCDREQGLGKELDTLSILALFPP